jgi:hypothetical protein
MNVVIYEYFPRWSILSFDAKQSKEKVNTVFLEYNQQNKEVSGLISFFFFSIIELEISDQVGHEQKVNKIVEDMNLPNVN